MNELSHIRTSHVTRVNTRAYLLVSVRSKWEMTVLVWIAAVSSTKTIIDVFHVYATHSVSPDGTRTKTITTASL
jgi:hypothetical protein